MHFAKANNHRELHHGRIDTWALGRRWMRSAGCLDTPPFAKPKLLIVTPFETSFKQVTQLLCGRWRTTRFGDNLYQTGLPIDRVDRFE
jgi:hypothetical protein